MMQLPSMITSFARNIMSLHSSDIPTVHEFTSNPNKAWEMLSVGQTVEQAKLPHVSAPINPNKVRFVCVSDTHNRSLKVKIPDGDVLLHTGDFTMVGKPNEVESFNTWLGTLPHKYKIVIAGNHELTFDPNFLSEPMKMVRFGLDVDEIQKYLKERGLTHMKQLLTNCTYLEDSSTSVYGITIYGSPWQPEFCDWAFNLQRGQECLDKWNMIPEGVDVLMTHGPPIGHGDLCTDESRTGCVELLSTIQKRVKCKYHVFGHIHEDYGATTDGIITYINACTATLNYRLINEPIIFDIPLPTGFTKDDFLSTEGNSDTLKQTKGATSDESEEMEEEVMDVPAEKVEEKGPLVLNQHYQLEPTLAPPSSTSTDGAFKIQ